MKRNNTVASGEKSQKSHSSRPNEQTISIGLEISVVESTETASPTTHVSNSTSRRNILSRLLTSANNNFTQSCVPNIESSIASTDTGPRSLSPSPNMTLRRDRIARAAIEHHLSGSATIEISSFASDDTGPISLTPNVKASKYAMNMIKAHRNHLAWMLSETEESVNSEKGVDSHSTVTRMKYQDPKSDLYGYYFGRVDGNFIPDGKGIFCSHDGQLLDGTWEKGKFNKGGAKNEETKRTMKLLITDDFNTSLLTCDNSTCSSLTASVNRQILLSKFAALMKNKKKKRRKPDYDVPSQIYVASMKTNDSSDTKLSFRATVVRKKTDP